MATVDYKVTENWGSGFIGEIKVAAGTSSLNGWTLEFDAPFDIGNLWNAVIVSHVGSHYVIKNADWNGTVPAGQAITLGFQATGATTASGLQINGGGTTVPPPPPPTPALPTLAVSDASVNEGNSGNADLAFTVKLSAASSTPVTVTYATANGTATAGSDYTAATGTITFAAGETSKVVHVAVAGDSTVEANETLALKLSNASGATIATAQATGTIVNDDVAPPPPLPTLTVADASVNEGNSGNADLAFTVKLSAASSTPVTVAYTTGNGTATAGSDYAAATGTITFAAGETSKVVHVAVTGDSAVEANETLSLTLSAASGATIAKASATGTIVNDDVAVPPPPPPASTGAGLDYGIVSNWGTGFTANMTVKAGSGGLSSWTIEFNSTATITNIWNATIVSHVGDHYVVRNADWNGAVAAGQGTTFGFQATPGGGGTSASGFTVNGGAVGEQPPVLPSLSVADASVVEGNAGAADLAFTVTLSQASATPVTVSWATANGSASAGSDFTAGTGTLTFAAGETSKVVHVAVTGDTAVEASETLTLTLSAANGATIVHGTALGTIVNDDVAPLPPPPPPPVLPTLSVSDVTVTEGNPSIGGGTGGTGGSDAGVGFFSTAGNQIVDADGHSVQIAGVNWFGFESSTMAPHGLWTRGYKDMMDQMVDLGFNTIRLPFSSEMLHTNAMPNGIDFSKNPDLAGLTALQIMDKIVDYAGQIGLRIILDHHRSDSGAGTSDNGLWYDASHSDAQWVSDWQMLASHYAGNSTVIGADLHNEPYNGTWGGGGPNDWAAAAERAGDAIGAVNPNWLVFVEGVGTYQGQSYWWGGNLMGVRDRPIELDVVNKLVYSAHDYPNSVYAQTWFQDPNFPANLPAKFDQMWGYIYKDGIAPVYLGEFGTNLVDPKDAPWLKAITAYLGGDLNNDGTKDIPAGQTGPSWTYWSWNPNSGDTGGILGNDWQSVNQNKLAYLTPIEFALGDGSGSGDAGDSATGPLATFTISLSAPATGTVTVNYHTEPGDAGSADFVTKSGTITFAAGEQTKSVAIQVLSDTLHEANEHFTLVLTDAQGATIARATGTATIVDDDAAPLPTLSVADATVSEGNSGTADLAFTVTLSAASATPVTVTYATANGTATSGSDYTAGSGTLTFAAGETSKVVHVAVKGDTAVESNETLTLALSGASGATIAKASATGTIVNDDAAPPVLPTLSAGNATVSEGNSGTADLAFTVALSAASATPVTVAYATANGTATAGSDYTAASGTLTFAVGETSKVVHVAVTGDSTVESNETLSLVLSGASGATIATASGTGTIVNDDVTAPPPPPSTSGSNLHGAMTVTDSWSNGFGASVAVHNDGSATSGWQLAIEMPYQITDIWNAKIISHTSTGYVIGGDTWNISLAHNGDTSFGFVASGAYSASNVTLHDASIPVDDPTTPGGLAAHDTDTDHTTLTWNASTPGADPITGYAVFVDGHQVATTTGTSYTVSGLDPATTYKFSVAALDEDGSSAQSTALSVHTHALPGDTSGGDVEFSPYIDMAMNQGADLLGISHASGIENFTLAFMLASPQGIGWQGAGTIQDDTLYNGTTILQQVQAIQAEGGHITISFGGAAGTEAALAATSASQLQAEYQSVIDRYGIDSIDFDIEGAASADMHSVALRNQAIAGLQAANPDLKVSYTLPVLPTGLVQDGLNLLSNAKALGVRVDLVNIMTMDYGQSVDNNGQMGVSAIQASEATQQQLHTLGIDARIGITPMIGVNDIQSEVFTLADAQMLLDYARNDPDVARLSMWSVARDNGSGASSHQAAPDNSGIQQNNYDFSHILHQYDVH